MVAILSSEKSLKRLMFRWTTRKGFTAVIAFLVLSFLVEYLLVWFFTSSKLMDKTALVTTIQVPFIEWSFTITISPIFHFIPTGVIIVLLSAWMYFTKRTATLPRKTEFVRKTFVTEKKQYSKGKIRFKQFRRFSRNMDRRFRSLNKRLGIFYHRLGSAVLRIRGLSYIFQRLSFARAATKSAVTTITVFLVFFFLLYLWGYPNSIYNSVTGFYRMNPAFLNFVLQTTNIGRGMAQVLSPIGALNSAILNAAPGFRSALENLGTTLVSPVAALDPIAKYAFFQYFAAIISAVIVLIYGESSPYSRRKS